MCYLYAAIDAQLCEADKQSKAAQDKDTGGQ